MSTPFIQEDCIGLVLTLSFVTPEGAAVSIAGASAVYIILQDVAGTNLTRTASIVGDGSTGTITYTTVNTDFTTVGTWKYQGKVVWPSGAIDFSEVKRLPVKPNLV